MSLARITDKQGCLSYEKKDSTMRVCHFEDALVTDLEPLTLTRPAYDLLCGCTTLAEKQRRYFGARESAALVRLYVAALAGASGAIVNDLDWLRAGPVVLVNARWLPPAPEPSILQQLDQPWVATCDGEVAFAVLTPDLLADCSPLTLDACVECWRETIPARPVAGRMLRYLWDVVERNGEEIELDAWLSSPERPRRTENLPALVGPLDRLVVDPTARIDPMVVADTTSGPVVIDRDAVIGAFTRLEGPCYIGPSTQLLGAKIRAGSSLGPQCRVGGEVECAVMWGYSNKYHDGFLGHAYVGAWVNLGAGTSNSDLRNDYGDVKVSVRGTPIDTRRSKVGCFLGDHVKTGLGTLLNTGTSVGVFCNLLPTGALLPKYVPSFANVWSGSLKDNADLDLLLATARKVMRRRGVALGEVHERLYRDVWARTASVRRQAIREAEVRRLRKSA